MRGLDPRTQAVPPFSMADKGTTLAAAGAAYAARMAGLSPATTHKFGCNIHGLDSHDVTERNMTEAEPTPWKFQLAAATHALGQQCARLRDTNPYVDHEPSEPALDRIIMWLATELWDRNFSQTEIRAAFELAVGRLSPYAAGSERRSEEGRRQW